MKGFTLIELLVVTTIISILVAMLASTFGRAKLEGQRGACLANSRTIKSLNLAGVPVVYAQSREAPYSSPFEGKRGYVEVRYLYGQRETILFVNCFDCHDLSDPFDLVHELVTVY
jgi:prepilin-type N-terminal cleavage/methylation domain-containing protein